MRDNITKKSNFIKRLEADFTAALLEQLSHRALRDLTISQLCTAANYPRSTFYRYYYDLEDLFTDYLLEVWDSVGFRATDNFYIIFYRLYTYQNNHPECQKIYRPNRDCAMFHRCTASVLKRKLLVISYMDTALRSSIFPSAGFIADYLLKTIGLLSESGRTLSKIELRQISVMLLSHPFREQTLSASEESRFLSTPPQKKMEPATD